MKGRLRVSPHPDGYWFWICRVHGPDDRVSIWCIQEYLSRSYTKQPAAMDGARSHACRHEPDGSLRLTADDLLQIV